MNGIIQSFIEDLSTEPTVFPATNSTSAFEGLVGLRYIHVIVAIYAIVLVLVIGIIVIIVSQSIKYTLRKRKISGYVAIPRQRVGGLDADIETLDDNSRSYGSHEDDSEFDNISVNQVREDPVHNASDVPPIYEEPPSYLDSGHHDENDTDIPPLYENPPAYLSINRC